MEVCQQPHPRVFFLRVKGPCSWLLSKCQISLLQPAWKVASWVTKWHRPVIQPSQAAPCVCTVRICATKLSWYGGRGVEDKD